MDVLSLIDSTALRRNLMSFVRTYPDHLAAAADNLASIGAALNAGTAAAAGPTTGVVPAAVDRLDRHRPPRSVELD